MGSPEQPTGGTSEGSNRVLPDPKICRAKVLTEGFTCCLVLFPSDCPHVFPFGTRHFCRHPQREEIVAKTMGREDHGSV